MRTKTPRRNISYLLLSLAALMVAAGALTLFSNRVSGSVQGESERVAREAIARALVTCYAAEGSYPPSLSHLEQHYGLVLDHDKYLIGYDIFASNVMPDITMVLRK